MLRFNNEVVPTNELQESKILSHPIVTTPGARNGVSNTLLWIQRYGSDTPAWQFGLLSAFARTLGLASVPIRLHVVYPVSWSSDFGRKSQHLGLPSFIYRNCLTAFSYILDTALCGRSMEGNSST